MANLTISVPEAAVNRVVIALSRYSNPAAEPSGPNARAGLAALLTDFMVEAERKRIKLANEQKCTEEEAANVRIEGIA